MSQQGSDADTCVVIEFQLFQSFKKIQRVSRGLIILGKKLYF